MRKSTKKTTKPRVITGDDVYKSDTAWRAAFLESTRAAASTVITECGVLTLYSVNGDLGIRNVVEGLEGGGVLSRDAFSQVKDVMYGLDEKDLSDKAHEAIDGAVLEALMLRLCSAYMLGVAVGQQIGSQALGKGGAR